MKKLALSLFTCLAAFCVNSSAQNLLTNGDFEGPSNFALDVGSPRTTGIWYQFSNNNANPDLIFGLSSVTPHSGTQELTLGRAATTVSFVGMFQIVTGLTAGQQLTYSGWKQSDSAPFGNTLIRLEWMTAAQLATVLSGGGGGTNSANTILPLESAYTEFSVNYTVPANTVAAKVVVAQDGYGNFSGGTLTGSVSIDDLVLAVPEPGTAALAGLGGLSLLLRRRSRRNA